MSANNTRTVSIDTKEQFIAQVRETGVVVDGGDSVLRTEGEGRATRYFVGGDKVQKAEIEAEYEAVSGDGGEIEVHVPAEDDEPEHGTIRCEVCGREVGYLTGSHMKTHEDGRPTTVAAYREAVAADKGVDTDEVPLAPDELTEVFERSGEHDEETLDELAEINRRRWEDGEYDHLRADDDEGNGTDSPWDDTEPAVVEA